MKPDPKFSTKGSMNDKIEALKRFMSKQHEEDPDEDGNLQSIYNYLTFK